MQDLDRVYTFVFAAAAGLAANTARFFSLIVFANLQISATSCSVGSELVLDYGSFTVRLG